MTNPTSPAAPAPPRGPRLQTPHWIAIVTAAVAIAVVAVVLIDRPGGSGNSKAASPATGVAAGASSNVIVSPVAGVASELATSSAAGSGQATTTTSTANGGQPGQPTRPAQPTATGHPTPAPTVTATATATVTATATATSAPTTTPTSTPTPTPTKLRPIPTRIIFPLKLNPDATGVYGDANLSGAFTPDPHSVPMSSAGGSIATSYLGGSCSGYASASPDLRVNYGGGSSLLRLYYVSTNGDPAMVVRDPYGNFYCVNDSFGTVSPTIDFNNPASGAYAIWICSPTSGATLTGTMYATRTTPNHP